MPKKAAENSRFFLQHLHKSFTHAHKSKTLAFPGKNIHNLYQTTLSSAANTLTNRHFKDLVWQSVRHTACHTHTPNTPAREDPVLSRGHAHFKHEPTAHLTQCKSIPFHQHTKHQQSTLTRKTLAPQFTLRSKIIISTP